MSSRVRKSQDGKGYTDDAKYLDNEVFKDDHEENIIVFSLLWYDAFRNEVPPPPTRNIYMSILNSSTNGDIAVFKTFHFSSIHVKQENTPISKWKQTLLLTSPRLSLFFFLHDRLQQSDPKDISQY